MNFRTETNENVPATKVFVQPGPTDNFYRF